MSSIDFLEKPDATIGDSTQQEIVLSEDQDAALSMFIKFLMDPSEHVMVLQGYAGTGKSTLVSTMMNNMDKYLKTWKLLNPNAPSFEVQLTATTNKAAEALSQISGFPVATIHAFLGLRVHKDYTSGETTLKTKDDDIMTGYILVIDEASMIDSNLLQMIFEKTSQCKILFIGDPAQLPPVKYSKTPVFEAGFNTARLTKVMRQAEGNPIITLATQFRETVNTGKWANFVPDQKHIVHLDQGAFEDAIIKEFTRKDWSYKDSKVLAWRNATVIAYNHAINNQVSGDPNFTVGDYVVCNKHVALSNKKITTDQLVYITSIEDETEVLGVPGRFITLDYVARAFAPRSQELMKARFKLAKEADDWTAMREIDERWLDLRAAFAQTINKSQGSTYNMVFIDLNDVARCNQGDQIARLMYVAVSRARHHVYLTGDFA